MQFKKCSIRILKYHKWHSTHIYPLQLFILMMSLYFLTPLINIGSIRMCFFEWLKMQVYFVLAKKVKLFQTKVIFLGHHIHRGSIIPIERAIEFASKFPNDIKDKKQLQRFLGSLNYISNFYKDLKVLVEGEVGLVLSLGLRSGGAPIFDMQRMMQGHPLVGSICSRMASFESATPLSLVLYFLML